MAASGFGREAGPSSRGPGSAVPAFGTGAATTPAPSSATPLFPSAHPAAPLGASAAPFPSSRPATPLGASTLPFPSSRPTAPLGASTAPFPSVRPATPRFPSPRPQITPAAATSRPVTRTQSPPVATPSARPSVGPGASVLARLSSSRPAVDPGAAAATGPLVTRHLQPQPRPASPSVSKPVDPFISPSNRAPSPLSNQRVGSPSDYDNGMGQRRLLNYADPLFENGISHSSEQIMTHPSDFGNRARSPLPNVVSKFRSPPTFHDHHPVQTADPHDHVYKFSGAVQSRPLDHNISKRSRSPTLSYQDANGAEAHRDAGANARRLVDYRGTFIGGENVETSKRMRSPSSEFTRTIKSPPSDIGGSIRSSPADFGGSNVAHNLQADADVQKSNVSRPKFGNQTQSRIGVARSPPAQILDSCSNGLNTPAASPPKPSVFSTTKRMDSPLDANSDGPAIPLSELEREEEAKAKRLARFHVELSRPVENTNDYVKMVKGSVDKPKQATTVGRISTLSNDNADERMDDMDSPELAAIVGLCPDMCPESERAERERKGDLDRYERLGGDRNQTTELLAVKKYNRTAERDADLIRPLPVLQKTMEYLLNLLDQKYDDSFLGLYNFLWDRMRAIRMDLRMQHFFNQDAISMLEQMIRLHIIAMHELCEYNKGEGFSEGFDAHLNIEQMNKTSVELFQMYDDHRRKGVFFPTEKEFRGYYALLKLDKHPGYKVEPAELSLDLAKMSREIRGSPEILFAREVARACRTGNFIAFFRLARKASYLQACLMHAHFAKLRRQALASLHSGLQIGQGIPVSHAVEWLAMEDEDIESLLEYHGFGLRQYEELYLVKEGPFLNSEIDFPSGCSQLVHSKKSQKIIDDVSSGPVCAPASKKDTVSSGLATGKRELFPPQHLTVPADGTGALDLLFSRPVSPTLGKQVTRQNSFSLSPKAVSSSSAYSIPHPPTAGIKDSVSFSPTAVSPRTNTLDIFSKTPKIASPKARINTKLTEDLITEDLDGGVTGFPQKVEMQTGIPMSEANTEPSAFEEPNVSHPYTNSLSLDYSNLTGTEAEFRESDSGTIIDMDEGTPPYHDTHLSDDEESGGQDISGGAADDRLPIVVSQKPKASDEMLKRILRKWRQRAADKRSLREQKNVLAIAALSSLSLGPPVHNTTAVPKLAIHELDIGHAFRERYTRQQRSWSRLNLSKLSGPILVERNPDASCLCWKLLLLVPPGSMESQTNDLTSKWLLRKLMGSGNDAGLIFASAGLSIWTEWISSPSLSTCCLSIVRACDQQIISDDITQSTSCIVFVVSEQISWEKQKVRFSSLLASIPAQSNLPLLILSGDLYNEGHDYGSQHIFERLGLNDLSGGKISSSLVVFLVENYMENYGNGFFDDDNLCDGLKWLTSKAPPQPDVTLVKTHELLLYILNLQVQLLRRHATLDIGPGDCISVFNKAVNQLAEEVLAAVHSNPNQWPAHEVDNLDTSSDERIFAETFLPSTGWSSPSRIGPLLAAINSCKLPDFGYDLSWLKQGSLMGKQTQDQKLFLQECLAGYLAKSGLLLNDTQVATEVNIMVQKYVSLELRDSYYYLAPRWISIFRRVYNWRLAKLSTGEFSEAYVLTQHLYRAPAAESKGATQHSLTADVNTTEESSVLEDHNMMPVVSTGVYLDEVIEINCDLDNVNLRSASALPPPLPAQVHEEPQAPALTSDEFSGVHTGAINYEIDNRLMSSAASSVECTNRKVGWSEFSPLDKDEKLARLLEECSNLQDRIDETLSIYF